jgi:hypothetical protein
MTIDSTGNVGIGITNPVTNLHVTSPLGNGDGTVFVENTGATWGMGLKVKAGGNVDNERFALKVQNAAGDDILFAQSKTGNVGIGTTNPSAVFHVEKHSNLTQSSPHFKIRGNVYTGLHWLNGTAYYIGQDSTTRSMRIFSGDSTTGVELMYGATAWSTFSDERLKENITNLDSVIDKIKDIRCVTYTRSDVENSKETIGFIAQDFIGKFDQVINKSKISDEDKEEYYSIKYTETIPVLMKAIQEQQQTIEDLKSQNESLAARISALES